MSIQTDLASISIIAQTHAMADVQQTLEKMVHTLYEEVSYFHWVGIFIDQGNADTLQAVAPDEDAGMKESSTIQIRIGPDAEPVGKIVVKSEYALCFDVTDLSTLERLADEVYALAFQN